MGSYVVMERYESGPRKGEKKDEKDCRYWRLYANGKKKNGKRQQRSKYFRGGKREMLKALSAFELEVAKERAKDMNFGDYCDEWQKRRKGLVSETTWNRDKASVETLKYYLGKYNLSELNIDICDDMYLSLVNDGGPSGKYPLKMSYIASIQSHLATVIHDAMRRGYLDRNPMEGCLRAPKRPAERNTASGDKLRNLLEKLDVRKRHEIGVFLCAALGLRRGEAAGLRYCDITWSQKGKPGIIHVQHSYTLTYMLKEPKTPESNRKLPMEPFVEEALLIRKEQIEADLKAAKQAGLLERIPPIDKMFVCCREDGSPTSPVALTKWWATRRHLYGFDDITLHELRHSFLTSAAAAGIHPRVMMSIAGHSSADITLEIYSHANMEMKENAFEKIAEILEPQSKQAAIEEALQIESMLAEDRGEIDFADEPEEPEE